MLRIDFLFRGGMLLAELVDDIEIIVFIFIIIRNDHFVLKYRLRACFSESCRFQFQNPLSANFIFRARKKEKGNFFSKGSNMSHFGFSDTFCRIIPSWFLKHL